MLVGGGDGSSCSLVLVLVVVVVVVVGGVVVVVVVVAVRVGQSPTLRPTITIGRSYAGSHASSHLPVWLAIS